MAQITIKNLSKRRLAIPDPINRILAPYEILTLAQVSYDDLDRSVKLTELIQANLISVDVAQDGTVDDELEIGSTAALNSLGYRQYYDTTENSTDLYVATDGDDAQGEGTAANPYATLQRALQHIPESTFMPDPPITIHIGPGTFPQPKLIVNPTNVHILGTTTITATHLITAIIHNTPEDGNCVTINVGGYSLGASKGGKTIISSPGTTNWLVL